MKKIFALLTFIAASLSQAQFEIIQFEESASVCITSAQPLEISRNMPNPPNWTRNLRLANLLEEDGFLFWSESAEVDHRTFTDARRPYLGGIITCMNDVFTIPADQRYSYSTAHYRVFFGVRQPTRVRAHGVVGGNSQVQGGGQIRIHSAFVHLTELNTMTFLGVASLETGPHSFIEATLLPGVVYQFEMHMLVHVDNLLTNVNSRAIASATAYGCVRLPKQVLPDPLGFL